MAILIVQLFKKYWNIFWIFLFITVIVNVKLLYLNQIECNNSVHILKVKLKLLHLNIN